MESMVRRRFTFSLRVLLLFVVVCAIVSPAIQPLKAWLWPLQNTHQVELEAAFAELFKQSPRQPKRLNSLYEDMAEPPPATN